MGRIRKVQTAGQPQLDGNTELNTAAAKIGQAIPLLLPPELARDRRVKRR
jgi:hypothetical protein